MIDNNLKYNYPNPYNNNMVPNAGGPPIGPLGIVPTTVSGGFGIQVFREDRGTFNLVLPNYANYAHPSPLYHIVPNRGNTSTCPTTSAGQVPTTSAGQVPTTSTRPGPTTSAGQGPTTSARPGPTTSGPGASTSKGPGILPAPKVSAPADHYHPDHDAHVNCSAHRQYSGRHGAGSSRRGRRRSKKKCMEVRFSNEYVYNYSERGPPGGGVFEDCDPEILLRELVPGETDPLIFLRRPRDPVNSGYAKTRQHLREKLKREKAQAEKKVPTELVTTNTVPLPTEDVDVLVSMIEGTHIQKSKKGAGVKGPDPGTIKTAKQEKKERQREKKRLEEEAQRKAEEERLLQVEEERVREELEQRSEELRKKREKKKRRKNKKKNGDLTVTVGGPHNPPIQLIPVMPVEAELPVPSKSSEMVTIRRHASAHDTTVTISVKSETGDEDLLYTLVNGQVFTDMTMNRSAGNAKVPEPGKGKGKKKKKPETPSPEVTISTGKANGHLKFDNTLTSQDVRWFGAGSEMAGSLGGSSHFPPGISTFLSPVMPSGPVPPAPAQTCKAYAPTKPFTYFPNHEMDEIDISKLKLPPGVTITKVNQRVPGQESESSEEEVDPMPPLGAGLYNIDSNMIVMNPDRDEGDEDSYNSDDYFFNGRQRAGEFETVLSNKEKRKRIKAANKIDETEGNGSSERTTSREQAPGAIGSNGHRGKRGSDPGLKSSSTSDKRDVRRGSGSTKRNGTAPSTSTKGKIDGYKDGATRKCRKEQRTPTQQRGGQEPGTSKSTRPYGKSDASGAHSYARTPTSPVAFFPQTQSPGFGEVPPPLPKITPMNTVKMADVVSGNHNRTHRETPEISAPVGRGLEDIPPARKAYYTQSFQPQYSNTIKLGELDISQQPQPPHSQSLQHRPESSNSLFNNRGGGNYDMWRSNLPAKESSESNFHSGGGPSSKLQGAGPLSSNSMDPIIQKQGIWPWGAGDDPLTLQQAPIRRPTPPYLGASPVFRANSPLGALNTFGTGVDPNATNLKFDSHSHPPQSSQPYVSGPRHVQVESPHQFLSRQQVNSSPALNRHHPRPLVGPGMIPYENFYSMHGESSGLPMSDPGGNQSSSNGNSDYLPHPMSNQGGSSQNFQRRPMAGGMGGGMNLGIPYGYSTQRSSTEVGGPVFPPTEPLPPPYLFCPIPLNKDQQDPPPNLDPRPGNSGSDYSLF